LFLPHDGQGDLQKHAAGWNRSERVKVRVLCFVCIGLLLSNLPYSFGTLSNSVETSGGPRQSDTLATLIFNLTV